MIPGNRAENRSNEKSVRLLIITKQLDYGGTEKIIMSICRNLKSRLESITVLSDKGVYTKELQSLKIRHVMIPSTDIKTPSAIIQTMRTIKKVVKEDNINLIHSHHRMTTLYCQMCRLFSKKIPLITTYHYLFQGADSFLTRPSDMNIAVSRTIYRHLINSCRFPQNRTHTILNSIKTEEFINPGTEEKLIFTDKKVITCPGRVVKGKGLEMFLDMAAILLKKRDNLMFAIAGDGDLREDLERRSETLGISDKVIFTGFCDNMPAVLNSSDIVLCPSEEEGFGLIVVEAMAAGTPVIASDIDAFTDLIEEGLNGLIARTGSAKDFAEKTEKLLTDSELYNKIKTEGFRISSEFSETAMTDHYYDTYMRCISE